MTEPKAQLEQFVRDGYPGCPFCGYHDAQHDETEEQNDVINVYYVCPECKNEWSEIYERAGVCLTGLDNTIVMWHEV